MLRIRVQMKYKLYIPIMILAVFLVSCSDKFDEMDCKSNLASSMQEESNGFLKLDVPSHLNNFKVDDPIFVIADNVSDSEIEVSPDRNLRIYLLQNNSWIDIKNKTDYLGIVERLAPRINSNPGGQTYFIDVDIPEKNEYINLCIVLEGIYDPDGAKSGVAAYTEITIKP
jgi:hypothetical protein